MTALRSIQSDSSPLTMDGIFLRIQAYIDRHEYPLIAAERVIADLCLEGRQDELLTLFWPTPIFEAWQSHRPDRVSEAGRLRLSEAQQRRHATTAALKATASRLESLVKIDETWRRLGDLDRAGCLRAASQHKRQALDVAHRARFYHAIAQQVPDGLTVRQTLNDEALARLYEAAGR